MAGDASNQVWLTSVITDDDVPKALTLCFSLKRVFTSRKVAVVVSNQVSSPLRQALHQGFDLFFYLEEDRNTSKLKDDEFAKLSSLTLKSFGKCVYLEPTMMAIKNSDEIFDVQDDEDGTAVNFLWPETGPLSIFAVRPSLDIFLSLMAALRTRNGSGFDNYVRQWAQNQSDGNASRFLDEKFNRIMSPQSGVLLGKDMSDVSIINIKDIPVDTNREKFGLFAQLLLEQWQQIYNGAVQPLLQSVRNSELPKIMPESRQMYTKQPIAIVGMSCRYPSANNLEEFWNLLLNGEDGTGTPPDFRWLREHATRQVADCRKTNAGFLKYPVEDFDAKFFGISPKEMIFLDPQHRLLHELVWEGLEDAALNPQELRGTNGGVFIGSWTTDYKDILSQAGNNEFYRMYMGNSIGAAAARISHLLELTGPSLATESGCSSAMVAVHLACKSLQRGETNFALACGVNLLLHPFNADIMPMVVSPDGHSKTFDAKADGFARAEGCGVLVLKRLSDAVRDGDKVWALIRGSGMTQEGVSKSMGTPTVHCESAAMKQALGDAQVHPSDVSYVEAHGTGTIVGDPMEVAAIAKAYHSNKRKEPLLIGSVKTNVGHTESCSGITGIMKVVLAMQADTIPPHRNFETLNPAINLDAVPAQIPLKPVEWRKEQGKTRFAGVSSFGITGTDAHAILEEAPKLPSNKLTVGSQLERPLHIMKVTAKTEEALDILLETYKNHFTTTESSMADLAYTANIGRADFNQRAVIIAKSNEDAIQIIEKKKLLRGEESADSIGKICFLFTGQGSQYPGMAKQLYETSPVFRMHFECCEKILKNQYNIDITQVLWSKEKSAEVSRTIYSQTSIFCVEYALLKLWESFGVKADFALGHSLGEFAAAVCAGILNVEDAIKLVAERSRLIDLLPRGKMLVIKADKQRVDSLMHQFAGNEKNRLLDYAAVNSPEQTVVAGDSELIMQFSERCKQANLKCIVLEATHAFHSKHMDPMLNDYRAVAQTTMKLQGDANCKYISGMRGFCVEAEDVDAEYWVQHTREKVLFLDASKKAVELGCKVFIEVGPQPVLSALTMMNNDTQLTCLPSLKRNESEWETLLNTIGKLYVKGLEIDWKGTDQFYLRKKVRLPHYPFHGKKFWPDMLAATGVSIHPLLGSVLSNASSTRLFQSGLNLRQLEYVKDHVIGDNIVFPGAGYLEMCLAAGLATVEGSTDALITPTRAMKVENLCIEAPLPLTESKTCQVQTVVELNENQGDWNDMRVSIFRKMESESNNKWLSHAKATFSPLPSAEEKNIEFNVSVFHSTLSREPDEVSEIFDTYERLVTLGLKFGPTFKSISKLWRNDETGTLLAKVNLPSLQENQDQQQNQYIIHPLVVDAMIQAFMMLRDGKKIKKLSVPIKIGKFIWLKGIDYSNELYIHAYQSEDEKSASSGSTLLVDSTGEVLAKMQSVELIDTTVKAVTAVLDQQTLSMPDVYEELWKPNMGARQYYTDMERASGQFYTEEFMKNNTEMNETPPKDIAETYMEVEHFVYLNILRGMHELGWKPVEGHIFEEESLFKELGIIEGYRLYFGFILEVCEQEGVLEKVTSGSKITWKVVQNPPSLEAVVQELSSSVSSVSRKFKGCLLFRKLGETLRAILKGEVSGLSILFPDDKADYPPVSDFYTEYGQVFRMYEMFSGIGRSWMKHAKAIFGDERMIVRVLEIGSGTGSFSEDFLTKLFEEGIEFEYTYTDISAAFFPAAEKRFEKYAKSMKFKKLNIEEDPLEQGFTPEYFDWVSASDVIHATKDIRQSMQNIRMLMKPHAKIDIQEMTKVLRFGTFTFGLLDGFWKFEDRELRPRHCTLSKQTWEKVLEETGFRTCGTFSTLWDNHSYICAERTEAPFSNYCDKLLEAPNSKTWLVFHEDSHAVSDYMERKMKEKTLRKTISVTGGDKFEELSGEGNAIQFKIRKGNEKDYKNLLQAVINKKLDIEGIVYCWALDKSKTTQEEVLQPYFYLTKAVLTSKLTVVPRLYAVTAGTVPLEDNDLSHFHSSTLLGFTRSLKNEIFGMHTKCIEVADGKWDEARMEELFYEIWNLDKDILVAFQGSSRFIPKLHTHKAVNNTLSLPKGTDRFQLVLPETKTISDLEFGPLDTFNLKEDEVEVQIIASALNFRDVLSIIKPSDDFKNVNTVGFDFAGVIKRTGSQVSKWKVGDRVCGCNVHFTAMPSHLQLQEDLLLQLPEHVSFCEGATMPAVYITSVLCLMDVAKIKKEDTVLIHTASGGVGLSAIEICKHIGCKVITTAGSKRKQNYLKSLGIQHIFHSRNTQFGDQILELTNGRGVDVVLNSLTGEGFKEATLKACAKGARFIEMSKLNIWTDEEVRNLRPDVKYTAVDLSQSNRDEWVGLLASLKGLLASGVVKPIPYLRFDALNVREALQYMQKAKHVGKIVCSMPELRNEGGEMKIFTPMFSDRSSYLITGGLGGIGFEVCKWMVEKGAKHVVLAGRSAPKDPIQRKITEMNSAGANVIPVQLDVGNYEQCKELIQTKMVEMGLPQLKGVMHAAGILADCLIANQTWPNLSSTFNTKVNGSLNLHELTKDLQLEHFVLFSSMAAQFGTPGQCNHSAGNLFEDTLAHYRHSIGLPATTVNWGQWGEVGIATEVDLPGARPLSNLQGITGLEYVMKTHRTQTSIFCVNSFVMLSKMFPQLTVYLDERIWKSSSSGSGSITIKSDEFWQQYDSASGSEEKVNVLKNELRNILRMTLKLDENDVIGDEVELQEMGVDSLMFVEIKNGLQTLLGDRLTVNSSALKDCNTVSLIATTLVGHIEGLNVDDNKKPTMEEVNALIREDCQLPEHIAAKPGQVAGNMRDVTTVLFTGCTGSLGPYVLKELTKLPQVTQVVCLMRPVKKGTVEERLTKILNGVGLLSQVDMGKIRCVTGNVADPHLGMEKGVWEEMIGEVGAIVHCAATVQHTEQYIKRDSKKDMRAVNIGGTKNVLEFACEKKLKAVYYASSILTANSVDEHGRLSEEWPEIGEFDGLFLHAYPITKYVSDMLLKQACERGIPCKSFRFPFIGGESESGRCTLENNHMMLRYMFIMKNGVMPSSAVPMPNLPVDICAEVSVRLFFEDEAKPGPYNVSHGNPGADQEFVEVAQKFGYEVDMVDLAEFGQRVQEASSGAASGDERSALELFKDIYTDEDAILGLFTNCSMVQKWVEEGGECSNLWWSEKVNRFIPNFVKNQKSTAQYVYQDLAYCRSQGWFKMFGL